MKTKQPYFWKKIKDLLSSAYNFKLVKTILLGDTHGRSFWKLITHLEQDADRVIFMGDYFDSFDIKGIEQIHNFKEIIEYKKTTNKEVILLLGNHDYHYFPGINDICSGYQMSLAPHITSIINENKEHLQVAYQFNSFVCSHAGISNEWMNDVFGNDWGVDNMVDKINELFLYQPYKIAHRPYKWYNENIPNERYEQGSGYGDETFQSPIWIRPKSLMAVNKETLRDKVIQIVGHTPQKQIDIEGKSTGGRYYFIDTLEYNQKQYLIIEDGAIKLGKI